MVQSKMETYETANNCAQVENRPKPGEVSSLLIFMGIGNHDGSLCSPQETSTDTQKSSSKNVETVDTFMNRNQQTDSVEGISNTTES